LKLGFLPKKETISSVTVFYTFSKLTYAVVHIRIFFRQSDVWNVALMATWSDSSFSISHLDCL